MTAAGVERVALDPIETASQDELRSLQLERLRWSLQHAYDNVAHYRLAFDSAGLHPRELKELGDLAGFPFTSKDDLRQNYPYGMFAVPREQLARIHASSGTTGKPTVVGYTRQDVETWAGLVARSIRAAGGRAGDIVHVAYGYGLFTGGLGAHYGAERLGCTVIPMSGGQTEKQVQFICDLETRGGMDAVDIYGLSEVIGPGVASECIETKDGSVIWEDHFFPEIIDPETGEVLPDGELGELVFTSLTKEAMPVIRYRTRDLTRLLPPTARSMRRMDRIVGRSDDMLIIRGVNVFPTQIEELVLGHEHLSEHYQIHVSRDGQLDELEVRCEILGSRGGFPAADQVAEQLSQRIKDLIGISARVAVLPPDSLERSAGKAKRVVDSRSR
jgi:phenylacetate-CoA ligase